ncbi:MerR family transcriptional regulator [Mycobacterium sp. MYCO198283]|uniref:MerR family transcriptional regulator n=1 Tax=Mycobacterium sp. MYCO198283 TaxID=2883505 RepID=UPI001E642959|nr:MerR family transcriptional regulator [Mycobacterium sp. MYCO198283]MCG5434152.1 MerR family transcriptional regulator [Mycobacterium sp. MYCO198283]
MAEYRIDDLARLSGVSQRNIRAYRERHLLEPPRKVGRTALYSDVHLAQVRLISDLLGRGFKSSHIAQFLAGARDGHDLADVLGFREVMFGPWRGGLTDGPTTVTPEHPRRTELPVAADHPAVRRLVELGIATVSPAGAVLVDEEIARLVLSPPGVEHYLRVAVEVCDAAQAGIERLAADVVAALRSRVVGLLGESFLPDPQQLGDVVAVVSDHRDLGGRVVARRLDAALRQQVVAALSEYTASLMAGSAE